ncbi:MAG: chemotaxis protein CheX [Deltaproteobacteria bacterium]|nr:chemotaxis protein CheX [Deltaproteobacteria bacterium]
MHVEESTLFELAETVWTSVLGLNLARAEAPPANGSTRHMIGCVVITGAWEGAVTIECPESMAKKAAGIMFGTEPEAASDDEVRDALGELANMIGGNVKALLPSPSQLSLPTVAEGKEFKLTVPGTHEVRHVDCDCDGESCRIGLAAKQGMPD